jgi:hypothetical protein
MHHLTRFRLLAVVGATAAIALGAAAPASAQTQQEGLVNINFEDINVQLPVSVAATLCDINVNLLAEQVDAGRTECDATAESIATRGSQSGGGNTQQEGLINVNVTDVNVQVPIAVAAALCDINVNVLAQQLDLGPTSCTPDATSVASAGPGQANGRQNR